MPDNVSVQGIDIERDIKLRLSYRMKRLILRINLIFVGLTGIFGVFVLLCPWARAIEIYQLFGIDLPPQIDHAYLEYLVYLGATLSVLVGILYFMAGVWPDKYSNLISFLGWSLLFIGGIVSVFMEFRLKLPPWPFYPDPIISFICGSIILVLRREYSTSAN